MTRTGSAPGRYLRRWRVDGPTAAAGLALLVVCSVAASSGRVGSLERSVFRAINELPGWLTPPMWLLQLVGMLAVVPVVAAAAWLLRHRRLAAAVLTAGAAKLILELAVVKQLVERERPGTTVPDAILRGVPAEGLSFPSGHAILAFAVAGVLAPYLGRRGRAVVYTLAVLNGVARVYLGAHNPLDVVAGAGLGVAIAAAVNLSYGVPDR